CRNCGYAPPDSGECLLLRKRRGIVIVHKHNGKTRNNREASKPTKDVSCPAFLRIHRLPIGKQFPQHESCCQAAAMRPIVYCQTRKTQYEQNNNRTDQSRTQILHISTSALRGDRKHRSDKSEQRTARSY